MLKPGVSSRLIFFRFHSAAATAVEIVILRAISSSSKSVIEAPSSTRARRLAAPVVYNSPEVKLVLPECPWPIKPRSGYRWFRRLSLDLSSLIFGIHLITTGRFTIWTVAQVCGAGQRGGAAGKAMRPGKVAWQRGCETAWDGVAAIRAVKR